MYQMNLRKGLKFIKKIADEIKGVNLRIQSAINKTAVNGRDKKQVLKSF
jgi:hypothetical protein